MRIAILMTDNECPYCSLGRFKHSGNVVLNFWRYSLEMLCLRSQSPALQGMLSRETDGLISQEADIVLSLAAVIMVCTVV
jgi:hypothetical protein